MINLLYFFLPMIIVIGIVTTYQDIKTGKIRNKWVMLGLAYAIVVNFLIYFVVRITGGQLRTEYYTELAVTVLISLVVGFVMWVVGVWTAGDAKLFTAFSALVPLSVYKYGHVQYFSSMNFMINTFVPFFVVYLFFLLFRTSLKQKIFYMKKSLKPDQLGQVFLFVFSFMWPLLYFLDFIKVPENYFYMIFFMFLLMIAFEKLFQKNLTKVLLVFAGLRIIFDKSLLTLGPWLSMTITFAGFVFLRYFILYMGYDYMTKKVDIKLLKKGMVPAEIIYKEKGKYRKQQILHFSLISYLQESTKKREHLFEPTTDGLNEVDVKNLKKLGKKLGFEHLRVYHTLSFAPYLFAGVILTVLFQGNLFISIAAHIFHG